MSTIKCRRSYFVLLDFVTVNVMSFVLSFKAASLLKRAEGIVTLIVCNPNKKDEKKEEICKTPKPEKKGKRLETLILCV